MNTYMNKNFCSSKNIIIEKTKHKLWEDIYKMYNKERLNIINVFLKQILWIDKKKINILIGKLAKRKKERIGISQTGNVNGQ